MVAAFTVFAFLVTAMWGLFYLKAKSTEPVAAKRKNRGDGSDGGFPTASPSSDDNCGPSDPAGCDGGGGGD